MVAFTFTTPHPFDPKYLKREWKINCEKINWIGWCFNLDLMRFLAELVDHMEIQS